MTALEIAANAFATVSTVLAGRNPVRTWWTGIAGSTLFAGLFFGAHLNANVMLQLAFIVTSAAGWRWWARGAQGALMPSTSVPHLWVALLGAVSVAAEFGYGGLLHHFTDAYGSFMLTLSLLAQLLLVCRQVETWAVWIAMNALAVPLYASRGLTLTAILYAACWCNARYGWWRWRREIAAC